MQTVQMMQSAVEIDQNFANYLLHEAWYHWNNAQMWWDIEPECEAWQIHWECARAMYKAWSKYTNIEFANGYLDLDKFSEEDFEEAAHMI